MERSSFRSMYLEMIRFPISCTWLQRAYFAGTGEFLYLALESSSIAVCLLSSKDDH